MSAFDGRQYVIAKIADCEAIGRGEMIRTSDLSVPNRAHYQAVLRPALSPVSFKKHLSSAEFY